MENLLTKKGATSPDIQTISLISRKIKQRLEAMKSVLCIYSIRYYGLMHRTGSDVTWYDENQLLKQKCREI